MKNLGTAKLTTYRVSRIEFFIIKKMFGDYVFSRIDKETKKCYVMLDKKQEEQVRMNRIVLHEVAEEEKT